MRGFHFGDSGHGSGLEDGRLRTAIVAVPRARGEVAGGRESEGRWMGKVEEGREVLTTKPIELWWPDDGDRQVSRALYRNRGGANFRGEEGERQSWAVRRAQLVAGLCAALPFYGRGGLRGCRARTCGEDDAVGCGSSSST